MEQWGRECYIQKLSHAKTAIALCKSLYKSCVLVNCFREPSITYAPPPRTLKILGCLLLTCIILFLTLNDWAVVLLSLPLSRRLQDTQKGFDIFNIINEP